MQSCKKYILIFLSVFLFSAIGKSNTNSITTAFTKFTSCTFVSHYSPLSKISQALQVNRYLRNRRSIREDDHRFFADPQGQNKIYCERLVTFVASPAEQRLHPCSANLIPSRAPPVL